MKSDTQLRDDVLAELAWDPAVRATEIGVTAKEGVVTLSGHLTSYAEKYAAEQAAQRVQGVKALAVEIDVRLPAEYRRTDADLAQAAEHALSWSVLVPDGKVHPMVERGWVTLQGEVEWEYQRAAAERAVHELTGITGVSNLVKVKPGVQPDAVERKIHDALARQADREARRVSVQVDGARVVLRGKVHSWAERAAAQGAAWSTPGVAVVTNELQVAD